MKVLLLAHHLPPKGRSFGRLALEYAKLMKTRGIEVALLTSTALGGRLDRRWDGLPTHQVLELPFVAPTAHLQATLDAFRMSDRASDDARIASSADVIMSFDWSSAIAASVMKRAFHKPLIHVYNGAGEARAGAGGIETAWIAEMEGRAVELADHVVVPSAHAGQELRARFPQLCAPVTCAPMVAAMSARSTAVDAEEFRRTLADPDDFLLLFVGAGEKRNGFDILLASLPEILYKNPKVKCVFVGEPPLDPGMREQRDRAERSGRLRVLGEIGDNVLNAVMQVADLLVAPSRYDPSGIGLWQAALAILPVVAIPTPAAAEAREAGCDVTIVPDPDAMGLTETILAAATAGRSRRSEIDAGAGYKRLEARAAQSAAALSSAVEAVCIGRGP
ncbi:MAG: glycosyltransferase family 4 protein [Planctomycetes bacterium]|nr:glycosyltransferase family 4 protein [Planctomycetota bacterium]